MQIYRFCRSRVGRAYLKIKKTLGTLTVYFFFKTLFRRPNPNLSIELATDKLNDGTGAQFQRILSTLLISHCFKIGYQHQRIQDVQVHPLDPFQDSQSYSEYLGELNKKIEILSTGTHSRRAELIFLNSLTLKDLFELQFLTKFRKRLVRLRIVDPYLISELLVDSFQDVRRYLLSDYWQVSSSESTSKINVVIHHRQGVGGKAIYPGQKIPRELDISYFVKMLDLITFEFERCQKEDLEICIHTDAPQNEVTYSPPENQLILWEGTPNYDSGKVKIIGKSLREIFQNEGYLVNIKSGGDPLDAILEMSQADYLITARSSMSYVGGILNIAGRIFSAPGFWHQPLKTWINGGVHV